MGAIDVSCATSKTEEQRVIELYKYYTSDPPPNGEQLSQIAERKARPSNLRNAKDRAFSVGVDHSSQISSPHTNLTALCQLAAIRLGVQRAGVSLIALQTQYILAESTRTLDLCDTTRSDKVGDGLWLGLTECSRAGNLCENTVGLTPDLDAEIPPCFTVVDLRNDDRFSNAPYVAGPPYMKFYCGTPVTTSSNFNVGSFWVLDDRLIPEFTSEQKRFLGTMASLVMRQLEMAREVSERRRAMKMGQALSSFVEGKVSITPSQFQKQAWASPFEPPLDKPSKAAPDPSENQAPSSAKQPFHDTESKLESTERPSACLLTEENASDSQNTVASSGHSTLSDEYDPEESIDSTFARATYLIREALDVQGCLFLNAAPSHLRSTDDETAQSLEKHSTDHEGKEYITWNAPSSQVPAEILAFAHETGSSLGGDSLDACTTFTPPDGGLLSDLTQRYPNGTIWTFGQAGLITPTESFPSAQPWGRRPSASGVKAWRKQRESEAGTLQHHFPDARQLIFAPLFDAALERSTAGCFAFNNRLSRILTIESEVVFLKSFLNNVGAEISRMSTIAADKSKSDFIGSISHELRSPLHGMLAAAEFLEETELDSYQKSLISIQVSCGKTLLQVIEHVLDISKINSLAREETAAGEQSSERMLVNNTQALSMKTDIAILCEEVVEGAVAGKDHIVRDISALNSRPSSENASQHRALQSNLTKDLNRGVAIILDFDYQRDWHFVAQPGALRRILMNVLGNALKYTDFGFVKVCLRIEGNQVDEGDEHPTMISLSISDTGKGISRSFLRTRLFRPFNQEDHLSTGCGLGLSIVRSLVTTLNGTLEVQSELGVGTTFLVKLPLFREIRNSAERPSIQRSESVQPITLPPFISTRIVTILRPVRQNATGELHGPEKDLGVREEIRASVLKTFLGWLQMKSLSADQEVDKADYVLVLADEISEIDSGLVMNTSKAIALLSHDTQRRQAETLLAEKFEVFETVTAPFGPRKLATAVAACELAAGLRQKESRGVIAGSSPTRTGSDHPLVPPSVFLDGNRLVTPGNADELERSMRPEQAQRIVRFRNGIDKDCGSELTSDGEHNQYHSNSSRSLNSEDSLLGQNYLDPNSDHSARAGNGRLLLVDDNMINLSLLETYVKRLKRTLEYECAENGFFALEAARKNALGFDIIFMDVSMPGMDGLEATREIRKLEKERVVELGEAAAPPPALIVALTGLANSRDKIDAFASGVDLFMTKPTKFKEIGNLIEEWCENGSRHIRARQHQIQDG